MQLDKIKKSIEIVTSYNNHYDVNFTVHENDFTLRGWSENQIADEIDLGGTCISIENLTDMHFIVDGKLKTLLAIIELIEPEIQTKADEWDTQTELDEIDDQRMRQELVSPCLSGRI